MMTTGYHYSFESVWTFEAQADQVWRRIAGFRYGEWWDGVTAEPLSRQYAPNGIGDKYRYSFRTKLPYTLTFDAEVVAMVEPRMLEIRASGELEGRGVWTLHEADGITRVRYTWQVNVNKKWMKAFAPLLKPVFVWNHDEVMRAGARGLASSAGVKLLSC